MNLKTFIASALLALAPLAAYADSPSTQPAVGSTLVSPANSAGSVDLTIYGNRLTQVQEERSIQLQAGKNQVQLDGIAGQYRPDSLRIVKVSGPGKFSFRSATYQGANLSADRVLADSVGKQIEVYHQPTGNTVSGKLLAVSNGQVVISEAGGAVRLLPAGDVRIANAPTGLSNTASLVLEADVSIDIAFADFALPDGP
ncbi:MAG: hypothetical protein K2X27_00565, partial [Candidatus Obscuribacterales bacterium]|nr:hypothetical protein [Candidatus Obscuribacterales bacterium]